MAENPSVGVTKGPQPKLGVPAPSFVDSLRVTEVTEFTETFQEDTDDSMAPSLIGPAPRRGHLTVDPSESNLLSSTRNFRMTAGSLGNVEEGNRSPIVISITGIAGNILGSVTRIIRNTAWGTTVTTTATEGVEWSVGGDVDATVTALTAYLDGLSGISALADLTADTVTVTRDPGTRWFELFSDWETDATITRAGAFFHAARGSARCEHNRYMTCQWSHNERPTTVLNVRSRGFTINGAEEFMRVTQPEAGTIACGAEFFPTPTLGPTTGTHRFFIRGRTKDKDSAAILHEIRVDTGGEIPDEETAAVVLLETRRVGEPGFGAARPIFVDKPFEIQNQAGDKTGLHLVAPRGAPTIQVFSAAGLEDDTITVGIVTAAGTVATILTEGVDFYAVGLSEADAARSIEDAINDLIDGAPADREVSDTVELHRSATSAADQVIGITLATSDAVNAVLTQEAAANTLTALNTWTVSSREVEATPTIVDDTRYQFHSLELISTTFDGVAWRLKPRSMSLVWTAGRKEDDFTAADNSRQDIPQGTHGTLQIQFNIRVEDNQYINLMSNDVRISSIVFEFEGELIGTTGERERFRIELGQGKILPFAKSITEEFEDPEDFTVQLEDTQFAANDFIECQWVNGIRRAFAAA